jgi:hypothetical protein
MVSIKRVNYLEDEMRKIIIAAGVLACASLTSACGGTDPGTRVGDAQAITNHTSTNNVGRVSLAHCLIDSGYEYKFFTADGPDATILWYKNQSNAQIRVWVDLKAKKALPWQDNDAAKLALNGCSILDI